MNINADLKNGYLISFTPDEVARPVGTLIKACTSAGFGYFKPNVYDSVPDYLVKDSQYFDLAKAPRTIATGSEYQTTLSELGLTLDFQTFEIVPIDSLIANVWRSDGLIVQSDRIPQLLAPEGDSGAVVTSIAGVFDSLTGRFYGNITTGIIDNENS